MRIAKESIKLLTYKCKIAWCVTRSRAGVEKYTVVRKSGVGSPQYFACYSQNNVGGIGILRSAACAIRVEDKQTSLLPPKGRIHQESSELVHLLPFLLNSS